jgi:hypothetical protein
MLQILGVSFHCATYTDRPWWHHRRREARPETGERELRLPRLRFIVSGAPA